MTLTAAKFARDVVITKEVIRGRSSTAIGADHGVSRARVHQIYKKTIGRVREGNPALDEYSTEDVEAVRDHKDRWLESLDEYERKNAPS